jgi:hypothetical protein
MIYVVQDKQDGLQPFLVSLERAGSKAVGSGSSLAARRLSVPPPDFAGLSELRVEAPAYGQNRCCAECQRGISPP